MNNATKTRDAKAVLTINGFTVTFLVNNQVLETKTYYSPRDAAKAVQLWKTQSEEN